MSVGGGVKGSGGGVLGWERGCWDGGRREMMFFGALKWTLGSNGGSGEGDGERGRFLWSVVGD